MRKEKEVEEVLGESLSAVVNLELPGRGEYSDL